MVFERLFCVLVYDFYVKFLFSKSIVFAKLGRISEQRESGRELVKLRKFTISSCRLFNYFTFSFSLFFASEEIR